MTTPKTPASETKKTPASKSKQAGGSKKAGKASTSEAEEEAAPAKGSAKPVNPEEAKAKREKESMTVL